MNQNKGIGAYKDRPGYFMGGMIGGAILGALVNKIQGKDWKRGALWGGTGWSRRYNWAGKAFGARRWKIAKWLGKDLPGYKKLPWYRCNLLKVLIGTSSGVNFSKYPSVVGTGAGAGAAQLMGDPEYDSKKIRKKERSLRK
jgi:hypothetical protein